jgi:N-methylhydantoinase B/oxoprolinase/acetone carboxylase alpha subunit
LDAASVWALNLPNFAGYGDPLERDPLLVATDLAEGKLSGAEALEVYGVVEEPGAQSDTGSIDLAATAVERTRRRRERLDTVAQATETARA